MSIDFLKSIRLAAMTGLCGIFVLPLAAQVHWQNRVCRTNDMWVNITNNGFLGNYPFRQSLTDTDFCNLDGWMLQCELPAGSRRQYLYEAGLWIGAKIVDDGVEQPRVSVGGDGWLNPEIMEFWGDSAGSLRAYSRMDSMDCLGEWIYDPALPADDEISTVFADTVTSFPRVLPDPVDGMHRPLGIEVKADYFTMRSASCNHIYWMRYRIKNIGSYLLKDLYFGRMADGNVREFSLYDEYVDDLTGFDTISQTAYICDNDGRRYGDSTGALVVPNVTGMSFLSLPEGARISYNWWYSDGDVALDFGPAWSDYADRDSAGLGWTQDYGTPMGDLHKYQILSNGEIDYDQVYADSFEWIASHPQNGKAWSTSNPFPRAGDVANGFIGRFLLSAGPFGARVGDHTELAPGDSVDVWMAYFGGVNFHNAAHPQPSIAHIDPTLFDFSDLRSRAAIARSGECFAWNLSADPTLPIIAPSEFTLEPVYPNPFNSSTMIRFSLQRTVRVEISVYDVMGRKVEDLLSETMGEGAHSLAWNAEGVSSGIYFVRASAGNQTMQVQKAMLIK